MNDNGGDKPSLEVIDFDTHCQLNTPDETDLLREKLVTEAMLRLAGTKVQSFAMVMVGEDGNLSTTWIAANRVELIGAIELLKGRVQEVEVDRWNQKVFDEPDGY